MKNLRSVLVLSDGSAFFGDGFGECTTKVGELVFSTAMTGYTEALTDPSFAGQILVSAYPLVGNYGVNPQNFESEKVWVEGYVVREISHHNFHVNSKLSLNELLKENAVPGVCGLDTRKLVRKIREGGVIGAVLSTFPKEESPDLKELQKIAKEYDYSSKDFVKIVTTKKVLEYGKGKKNVVLIDGGCKKGIVSELVSLGLRVIVLPAYSTEKEIRECNPDGIVLSNGPGDPARMKQVSSTIKNFFGELPVFGVCLGNQLIGQAAGATCFKLKFGHRSANQPVKELETGRVVVTTQNHGFAINEKKLNKNFRVTHVNLNDGTVEGVSNDSNDVFSVQYHPEARPGPRDSKDLFEKFAKML